MQYSSDEIRRKYKNRKMISLTPHSITDVETLVKAVEENKERGYSTDIEEKQRERYLCFSSNL